MEWSLDSCFYASENVTCRFDGAPVPTELSAFQYAFSGEFDQGPGGIYSTQAATSFAGIFQSFPLLDYFF